jgi:hypothetical protein
MIPHRLLRHDAFGIGVRDRAGACRKHLRVIHAIHKVAVADQMEEEFQEITISAADVLDGYPAMRKSTSRLGCCSISLAPPEELRDCEEPLPVAEPEAGKT